MVFCSDLPTVFSADMLGVLQTKFKSDSEDELRLIHAVISAGEGEALDVRKTLL